MGARKRNQKVQRRPGSKIGMLESVLIPFLRNNRGKPTALAIQMSHILGFPVDKRDIRRVLSQNNYSKKKKSIVPSLSVPLEREKYLQDLLCFWKNPNQLVFVDEKKYRTGDILSDSQEEGYAPIGDRLSASNTVFCMVPILPPVCEVIGGISVLSAPDILPLRDGRPGNVGLISMKIVEGALGLTNILSWFESELCPLLTPYPGPRSIVVIDNLPQHRSNIGRIRSAINARGAFLLFNPPRSPDLNPIEKLWDVTNAGANRRMVELASGVHGAPRRFCWGDLIFCLQNARMSEHSYHSCFQSLLDGNVETII
jgi:hypothetical protein